jgi:hypothetical protein
MMQHFIWDINKALLVAALLVAAQRRSAQRVGQAAAGQRVACQLACLTGRPTCLPGCTLRVPCRASPRARSRGPGTAPGLSWAGTARLVACCAGLSACRAGVLWAGPRKARPVGQVWVQGVRIGERKSVMRDNDRDSGSAGRRLHFSPGKSLKQTLNL